jgi:hypothetical protein
VQNLRGIRAEDRVPATPEAATEADAAVRTAPR